MSNKSTVVINRSTGIVVIITNWDTFCEEICGWPECKSVEQMKASGPYNFEIIEADQDHTPMTHEIEPSLTHGKTRLSFVKPQ